MNIKRVGLIFFLPFTFLTGACNKKIVVETKVRSVCDKVFGNIDFELTQTEFESKGINYDDLLEFDIHNPLDGGKDTVFEAAFVKNYNEVGYFAPCLCNYGGTNERPQVSFGIMEEKNDPDILVGRDVTIKVLQKGGYHKTRELVDVATKLTYEELGKDNLAYANFRDVTTVGTIGKYMYSNRLFRGSSPFNPKDNPDDRDMVADSYLDFFNIKSEISLANSEEKIEELMKDLKLKRPTSASLKYYEDSKLTEVLSEKSFFSVDLGSDYFTIDKPGKDGANALRVFEYAAIRCRDQVSDVALPIYVHCNEGKDRTGFIIMVFEAMSGVPIEDIVADAMLTFKNYYNVSIVNNREKYDTLANLLIYRQVYSILIENPSKELSKINWYDFDAKQKVEEIIAKKPNALKNGAFRYLDSIQLSDDFIHTLMGWISKSD